jgi:hypothetical protein
VALSCLALGSGVLICSIEVTTIADYLRNLGPPPRLSLSTWMTNIKFHHHKLTFRLSNKMFGGDEDGHETISVIFLSSSSRPQNSAFFLEKKKKEALNLFMLTLPVPSSFDAFKIKKTPHMPADREVENKNPKITFDFNSSSLHILLFIRCGDGKTSFYSVSQIEYLRYLWSIRTTLAASSFQ